MKAICNKNTFGVDINGDEMPVAPIIIGEQYEVRYSKIDGNLDLIIDNKVVGSYPIYWFII